MVARPCPLKVTAVRLGKEKSRARRTSDFRVAARFVIFVSLRSTNMSANLRLQKRLAADVLGVGKKKVWLDPNEIATIGMANSRTLPRSARACGCS